MSADVEFPGLAGVVLAAGLSRRAGPRNKLLEAGVGGMTLVRSVTQGFCEAGLAEVIVVLGHEAERVRRELAGLSVRCIFAEAYARGMGASLAAGVRAVAADVRGLLVTPADLPDLAVSHVRAVARRFVELDCARHVIPTAQGERGHPVALGLWLRPALEALDGDVGARNLLSGACERGRCEFLELGDPAICRDRDQ